MRKQLLKGFTMLMAVMAIALVTAVTTANGQTQKLRSNIPFEFVVGNQALSAGKYSIATATNSGDLLRIKSEMANDSAVLLTIRAAGKSDHAKLLFHRYGERYFLAEVWTSEGGRALATSRQERAIQKELSRIASNRSAQRAYETVEIALAVQ